MDWAFEWIKKNGGLDTEEDWGYYSGWGFGTWCNARKQQDRCSCGAGLGWCCGWTHVARGSYVHARGG
jgi:hypothetical protein